MDPLTPHEVAAYYASRVPSLPQREAGEWRGPCPIHNGRDANFSVQADSGRWYCHSQCARGGDIFELEMEMNHDTFPVAKAEVFRLVGRPEEHRNGNGRRPPARPAAGAGKWQEEARYPYLNASGDLLFEVVRLRKPDGAKTFLQVRPSGSEAAGTAGVEPGGIVATLDAGWYALDADASRRNGKSTWKRTSEGTSGAVHFGECPRVPYRLPALQKSPSQGVVLVEGEKDVHSIEALGLVASCNPGGAGNSHLYGQWAEIFRGRLVLILPDNDQPGRRHAATVAGHLLEAGAIVHVAELPDLPEKGDVTDWIQAGGTEDELLKLLEEAEQLDAAGLAALRARLGVDAEPRKSDRGGDSGPQAAPSLLTQHRNDVGNAERLIALYGDRMRYCHAFKKWLIWDGRRWAVDESGAARLLATEAMLAYLGEATHADDRDHMRFAYGSLEARRIANLLSMAEPRLAISTGELDAQPFLLNFLNGTVDLRTGELTPHDPSQLLTKLVHHNYSPEARCPLFQATLAKLMGNRPDSSAAEIARVQRMVAYLQKAMGYSITGVTSEKAVFVVFGAGNNGKTTLLSTFLALLEEYAVLLQAETLMCRSESSNSQADLADLRGARLVVTSETEEGQRLAQGKLKRITQGMGNIKATRKYENPIMFPETHKLWMDTNTKPAIRSTDDQATFNRLHPIPFTLTIRPEEMDKGLPQKLLAEADGILAWMVEGAKSWFASGLEKPPEVAAAAEVWRGENDNVARFLDDCCVLEDGGTCGARELYEAYRSWSQAAGESPIAEMHFARRMMDRGFEKRHSKAGKVYVGISLSQPDSEPERSGRVSTSE